VLSTSKDYVLDRELTNGGTLPIWFVPTKCAVFEQPIIGLKPGISDLEKYFPEHLLWSKTLLRSCSVALVQWCGTYGPTNLRTNQCERTSSERPCGPQWTSRSRNDSGKQQSYQDARFSKTCIYCIHIIIDNHWQSFTQVVYSIFFASESLPCMNANST
jgi:hypothetical protein